MQQNFNNATVKYMWENAQIAAVCALAKLKNLFIGELTAYIKWDNGYEGKDAKLSIVNWLAEGVTKPLSDLLAPEVPAFTATGAAKATLRKQQVAIERLSTALKLHALLGPTARTVSYAGGAWWKLYWSPTLNAPQLRLWGAKDGEYCFPEVDPTDPGAIQALNFWYPVVKMVDGKPQTYYLRERQSLVPAGLQLDRTAYTVHAGYPTTNDVPLAAAWPTAAPPPPVSLIPGVTNLLGYQLNNVDALGDGTGDSDYTLALQSLQEDFIKLNSSRQAVILLLKNPLVSIPAEMMDPTTGLPDWQRVKVQIQQNGEDRSPIEIANTWNGNLDDSATQEALLMRQFFLHSPVSPTFLGESVGSVASGVSKSYDILRTTIAVKQRRATYPPAFQWLFNTAMQLEQVYQTSPVPPVTALDVTWPDIAIHDDVAEAAQEIADRQTMLQEVENGVRSKQNVVAHLQHTEADVKLELIRLGLAAPDTPADAAQATLPAPVPEE